MYNQYIMIELIFKLHIFEWEASTLLDEQELLDDFKLKMAETSTLS